MRNMELKWRAGGLSAVGRKISNHQSPVINFQSERSGPARSRAPLTRLARLACLLPLLLSFVPASSWACAACYGQADGPMAEGMNWGILSLLGIICAVLVGVASCFIVLARRASRSVWTAPYPGALVSPARGANLRASAPSGI